MCLIYFYTFQIWQINEGLVSGVDVITDLR